MSNEIKEISEDVTLEGQVNSLNTEISNALNSLEGLEKRLVPILLPLCVEGENKNDGGSITKAATHSPLVEQINGIISKAHSLDSEMRRIFEVIQI